MIHKRIVSVADVWWKTQQNLMNMSLGFKENTIQLTIFQILYHEITVLCINFKTKIAFRIYK